jgi:hypothetical protein
MIVDGKKYVTEKEIATIFDLPTSRVRNIRYNTKDFPYYKFNCRIYYKEDEVFDWLKKNIIPM